MGKLSIRDEIPFSSYCLFFFLIGLGILIIWYAGYCARGNIVQELPNSIVLSIDCPSVFVNETCYLVVGNNELKIITEEVN